MLCGESFTTGTDYGQRQVCLRKVPVANELRLDSRVRWKGQEFSASSPHWWIARLDWAGSRNELGLNELSGGKLVHRSPLRFEVATGLKHGSSQQVFGSSM